MKGTRILFVTGILAVLGQASSLEAQIIIDGFLNNTVNVVAPGSPASVLTNNIDGTTIDRQLSVQATGSLSIVSTVIDGVFVLDAGGTDSGTANAQLLYLGYVIDLGANTFFQFTINKVVGTPILGLILGNSSEVSLSGGIQLVASNVTNSYFLDITQLTGYTPAFGATLDSIEIFIGSANQNFFVEGELIQFNSVPEPSVVMLLGFGLFGLAARRSRSR